MAVMLGSANTDERSLGPTSTRSTSTAPATGTSPSAAAPTAASARTWPAWSCGWRWRSGTPGSPTTAWPRGTCPYSQGLRSVDNLTLEWDV